MRKMKIEMKYPYSLSGDIIATVLVGDKIERVSLKISSYDEAGEFVITHEKIKGHYINNIRCIDCFHDSAEFLVKGISILDKFDIENLSNVFAFNELLDAFKEQVLNKVSMIKSLFRPVDETAEVYAGEDEKRRNLVIRLKHGNVKGLISIPDFVDDVIFVYNDGKRKAKIWAFMNSFVELKYKDERENIYIYFAGDSDTSPVGEIDEYLDKNGYGWGEKQLVVDKNLAIQFANMFLTSNSLQKYVEEVIDEIISKFKI